MSRAFDPTPIIAIAQSRFPGPITDAELGVYLGVSERRAYLWRSGQRRMNGASADHAAIALGLHPLEVWPDYYDRVHGANDPIVVRASRVPGLACAEKRGTRGGYQRHRAAGEDACAECKAGNARRTREYTARRQETAA